MNDNQFRDGMTLDEQRQVLRSKPAELPLNLEDVAVLGGILDRYIRTERGVVSDEAITAAIKIRAKIATRYPAVFEE